MTIAAHSMGAAITLHFLTQSGVVTQAWKDHYIGNFVPIAEAWSGGNSALQFEISGLTGVNRGPGDMLNFLFRLQDFVTDPFTSILRSYQKCTVFSFLDLQSGRTLSLSPARSYTASD